MKEVINLDQLSQFVKTNPQYTRLFIGLSQIDRFVKKIIRETIESHTENPDSYYIKTELANNNYVLNLYHAETKRTINYSWSLELFLNMCRDKTIEFEIQSKTMHIINQLTTK